MLRENDFLLQTFVDRFDCIAFVETSCLNKMNLFATCAQKARQFAIWYTFTSAKRQKFFLEWNCAQC